MDDDLKRMFEAMAATPSRPEEDEAYQRRLGELYERHPNRWVLYREDWSGGPAEFVLHVLGPFSTQREAVERWDSLPEAERNYTLTFIEDGRGECVRVGSPVTEIEPPAPQATPSVGS